MSLSGQHFLLRIEPACLEVAAPAELTLLEAALLAGVSLPSSCRNGTCRTCLCRMTAGQIRYGVEWPGVSAEERLDGYILPCVAHPASDIVIEVPLARVASASRNGA